MNYNIFLYWEDKPNSKRHLYLNKCLETIKKHNKNVVVVTPKNINNYIPKNKINPKIWKLDGIAQRADYFRYLLLHHNGGLWLDFDTICFDSFSDILLKLDNYELLFHSEQFFAVQKGKLEQLINEVEQKIDKKITRKYLIKQNLKKLIFRLGLKNSNYKIMPFYWAELGLEVLKKNTKHLCTYKIPQESFKSRLEYNWESKNNKKIHSKSIKVEEFIHKNQLIIKLYNSGYKKEDIVKLNYEENTLFNKLINYSLSK